MSDDDQADFDVAHGAVVLSLAVGAMVREARVAAGVSQRELAARMGTSQPTIARLEAGGVGATLTTLHRAASALGMRVVIEFQPAV